jgi:ribonuclease HI
MFEIWTDGGTGPGTPDNCVGSWAFVAADGTQQSGLDMNSTNNRAELMAIIKAVEYAKSKGHAAVKIYSDSDLCIKCAQGKWKVRKNLDYWRLYHDTSQDIAITFEWVKGHSGIVNNEIADKLCTQAIISYKTENAAHCKSWST